MKIENRIVRAEFLRRPNRFQAYVICDGIEIMVHVPNTGRCKEILIPGSTVILREELNPKRKTKYDLIAAYKGEKLINIDSQIPNKVVQEALNLHRIEKLKEYDLIEREKFFGNSRFDFKLTNTVTGNEYYLEVKGVTLEEQGKTKFPDAPTERGTKHLIELAEAVNQEKGAGVLFLIQMDESNSFSPNDERDSTFGKTLRNSYKCGVDVLAYNCMVLENEITLNKKIQVQL